MKPETPANCTFSVRIPTERDEQLTSIAAMQGKKPAAFARESIIDGMTRELVSKTPEEIRATCLQQANEQADGLIAWRAARIAELGLDIQP